MHNQSTFVKIVIWLMIFLMSAGFAALVIAPFAGNLSSLFGNDGRSGQQKLIDDSRDTIAKHNCDDASAKHSKRELSTCKEALQTLASAYTTLASPPDGQTDAPKDSQKNLDRAGTAWKALYQLDTSDDQNAARYAGYLLGQNKANDSLVIWKRLVKKNPTNGDYLLQQGSAQAQAQDLDSAIATFKLYLKRFPEQGDVPTVKKYITQLQDQKKQQAAGGAQPTVTAG